MNLRLDNLLTIEIIVQLKNNSINCQIVTCPIVNRIKMNRKDLRIVFLGTPDFAVESLKALVEGGYNVVACVTMPDKPGGRHHDVLQSSPVKKFAQDRKSVV